MLGPAGYTDGLGVHAVSWEGSERGDPGPGLLFSYFRHTHIFLCPHRAHREGTTL